jgi:hypothetical protein
MKTNKTTPSVNIAKTKLDSEQAPATKPAARHFGKAEAKQNPTTVSKMETPVAARPTSTQAATAATVGPTGVPANPKDMAIVCPVLGSLIAEGKVPMAPDGTVKIADLRKAFAEIGFTEDHQNRAAGVGRFANELNDVLKNSITQEFNVLDMREGLIKHQGDSAILTAGQFDQGKFDAFVSHAKDGVMTEDSFASAIAANYLRDFDGKKLAASRAKDTAAGEYGALLAVFGTKDPATGKLGIKVEDLRKMFQDKDLPEHMRTTSNADISAMKKTVESAADAYLANSAFRSTWTPTGLATAGARLADGGLEGPAGAVAQASSGAGKAAACPYMNGAVPMPTNQAEISPLHNAAAQS